MDPLYLKNEELEYELGLRGIFNLSTRRALTKTLREILAKEKIGLATAPNSSAMLFTSFEELRNCSNISADILKQVDNDELGELSRLECLSRLFHLKDRIVRILPTCPQEITQMKDLIDSINNVISYLAPQVDNAATNVQISPNDSAVHRSAIPISTSIRSINNISNNSLTQTSAKTQEVRRSSSLPISVSANYPTQQRNVSTFSSISNPENHGVCRSPTAVSTLVNRFMQSSIPTSQSNPENHGVCRSSKSVSTLVNRSKQNVTSTSPSKPENHGVRRSSKTVSASVNFPNTDIFENQTSPNTVIDREANLPYAWPQANQISIQSSINSLARDLGRPLTPPILANRQLANRIEREDQFTGGNFHQEVRLRDRLSGVPSELNPRAEVFRPAFRSLSDRFTKLNSKFPHGSVVIEDHSSDGGVSFPNHATFSIPQTRNQFHANEQIPSEQFKVTNQKQSYPSKSQHVFQDPPRSLNPFQSCEPKLP